MNQPSVFIGGPYVIDEGNLLSLDATGSDPDPGDAESLSYGWDLDGDGDFDDATSRKPVLTWEQAKQFGMTDDGTYPIVVRVEDTFGEQAFSSSLVTVNNSSPSIVNIQAPPTVDENSPVTLTGSFTDAGPDDTHTVIVDWGDGATSEATVDALARTFTASHVYTDDAPTATPADDYTVEVTLIDDDGGVSGDELRSSTVQTSRVGGIEFPSFHGSLPSGTSGLMLEAETTVSPQAVTTSSEPAQEYAHTHVIDYPPSESGPFNLDPVTTSVADASDVHSHSYPSVSSTIFTDDASLATYYGGSSDRTYSMLRRTTEPLDASVPYAHTHETGTVAFDTHTTFNYELPRQVLTPQQQANTNYVRLNGDARFVGNNTHLTGKTTWPGGPANHFKQGSLIVRKPRRTTNFNVNFDQLFLFGSGGDGMGFAYAPMSTSSNFGLGISSGLYVGFHTWVNNRPSEGRIVVRYNGTTYASWTVRRDDSSEFSFDGLRGHFRSPRIRVRGSSVYIDHPAFGNVGGTRVVHNVPINPSHSWRFGFSARTGGLYDMQVLGSTTITDNNDLSRSVAVSRTAFDQYVLPRFDTNLGTLRSATTTLTMSSGQLQSAASTEVPHAHSVDLLVEEFAFPT